MCNMKLLLTLKSVWLVVSTSQYTLQTLLLEFSSFHILNLSDLTPLLAVNQKWVGVLVSLQFISGFSLLIVLTIGYLNDVPLLVYLVSVIPYSELIIELVNLNGQVDTVGLKNIHLFWIFFYFGEDKRARN